MLFAAEKNQHVERIEQNCDQHRKHFECQQKGRTKDKRRGESLEFTAFYLLSIALDLRLHRKHAEYVLPFGHFHASLSELVGNQPISLNNNTLSN